MFNFVSKSLLVRHWRHGALIGKATPTLRFQHCLSLLTIRCISTTATTKEKSLTASYLINSCGLSPESALSASKRLKLKSTYKADAVISFFKSHGFSQTHISNIIKKLPEVLLYDPEKTILPKLEFLYSKGFSNPDTANILSKCPPLLSRSLENHIIPNFNYLSNLVQSQQRPIASIKSIPLLLYHDLQTHLAPKFNILLEHGVPISNIFKHISCWTYSFTGDTNSFKMAVDDVKEMGMNPLRSRFVLAVCLKASLSRSKWEGKASMYKRWGWSEVEFLGAFQKYPGLMATSEDKIMAGMDFFVNKMGLESSYIAKSPFLLGYSLQKRVIPRAAVFQFLLTKGLIKSKHTCLTVLFQYSEIAFLARFVNSYDEAPQLLKLYREKLDPSKNTK